MRKQNIKQDNGESDHEELALCLARMLIWILSRAFRMYEDGHLFRKESRLQQPRRHVSANEVFDILTAEHLLSGHQGRDKMLKILETKYIGYTKDELMFVLDRCSVCSAKQIRGAAARRRENRQSGALDLGAASPSGEVDPNL